MEFITERLKLREYTQEDKYDLYDLFSKEYVARYAPYLKKKSIAEIEDYIKFYTDNAKSSDRTHYFFIAELRKTNNFIGIAGYSWIGEEKNINNISGASVELEYFLLEEYWNDGYMTEALRKLISFAFEENKVQKISAWCRAENIRSERVMIKCGMYKSFEQPAPKMYNGELKERLKYELTAGNYIGS